MNIYENAEYWKRMANKSYEIAEYRAFLENFLIKDKQTILNRLLVYGGPAIELTNSTLDTTYRRLDFTT